MSKKTSYRIHPEHQLTPMKPLDPFYCTACKEIGFGTGYGCSQCVVRVHKECMNPSLAASLKLKWRKHSLKFYPDVKAEDGKPRYCAMCSKPVSGCGYRSSSGKNCHPSCLALPQSIVVNSVELHLAYKVKLNCTWCGMKKRYIDKVKLPSWSYVGGKAEYHVGCVKDMVTESWRNGEFVPAKEGDGVGRMQIKVDLASRGISGNLGRALGTLALRGTLAALNGDPTELLG
ncbi:uncharacterized protein LOC104420891 [Eucalyptus grandis]|uniref:Uncharacterized protein n=2 Tax=Eucalyptus grandis TaxID=71139 RepID=A0ACC3J1W7_EUCGR|nr:uncharacterized protein LOC104420891 [Eucalyptus grandis]KAK3407595.1 hypothetical protein EUGRSUZ_J00016 [Eucalyptus grandis]